MKCFTDAQLTDGAGFPPFAVHTRVKFWAWYRLKGAGVFSATTDILFGGAVEDRGNCETLSLYSEKIIMHHHASLNCQKTLASSLLKASQRLFCNDMSSKGCICRWKLWC